MSLDRYLHVDWLIGWFLIGARVFIINHGDFSDLLPHVKPTSDSTIINKSSCIHLCNYHTHAMHISRHQNSLHT